MLPPSLDELSGGRVILLDSIGEFVDALDGEGWAGIGASDKDGDPMGAPGLPSPGAAEAFGWDRLHDRLLARIDSASWKARPAATRYRTDDG